MKHRHFLVLYCRSASRNWLRFVTGSRKGTTFGRSRMKRQTPRETQRPRLVVKYIYFDHAWTKRLCADCMMDDCKAIRKEMLNYPVIIILRIWLSSLMSKPLPLWIAWIQHPKNPMYLLPPTQPSALWSELNSQWRNQVLYLLSILLDHTNLAFE